MSGQGGCVEDCVLLYIVLAFLIVLVPPRVASLAVLSTRLVSSPFRYYMYLGSRSNAIDWLIMFRTIVSICKIYVFVLYFAVI